MLYNDPTGERKNQYQKTLFMAKADTKPTKAKPPRSPQLIVAVVIALLVFIATASLLNAQNRLLREQQTAPPKPTPTSQPTPKPTRTPTPTRRPTPKPIKPTTNPNRDNYQYQYQLPNYPTLTPRPLPTARPTLRPVVDCVLSYGIYSVYEETCKEAKEKDAITQQQQQQEWDEYQREKERLIVVNNTLCMDEAKDDYYNNQRIADLYPDGSEREAVLERATKQFERDVNNCNNLYPIPD